MAPAFIASTAEGMEPWPVITMPTRKGSPASAARSSAIPSMCGIMRSVMITSNFPCCRQASASAPEVAPVTS